jgi:hypothetical protein
MRAAGSSTPTLLANGERCEMTRRTVCAVPLLALGRCTTARRVRSLAYVLSSPSYVIAGNLKYFPCCSTLKNEAAI